MTLFAIPRFQACFEGVFWKNIFADTTHQRLPLRNTEKNETFWWGVFRKNFRIFWLGQLGSKLMRKFTQSPGPLPTWKRRRDLHPPRGSGSDLPGYKNSAHHFGGRIGYRYSFYTIEKRPLLRCGVTLLSSKRKGGRLSPSYFGSVIAAFHSLSSSTPIYTSVEEEKSAGIGCCFISAWPLSLFFLNIRKTASSKLWGYIALRRRGRAGVWALPTLGV